MRLDFLYGKHSARAYITDVSQNVITAISRTNIPAVAGRGRKRASAKVDPDRCLPLCPNVKDCTHGSVRNTTKPKE